MIVPGTHHEQLYIITLRNGYASAVQNESHQLSPLTSESPSDDNAAATSPRSDQTSAPFDRWHRKRPPLGHDKDFCGCDSYDPGLLPSTDHGRGRRWQARYTDPTGRRRRPGFASYDDARECLERVHEAIRDGTWSYLDVGSRNVAYFAAQMIERRRKRNKNPNTIDTYESHLRNHIVPFAGTRTAHMLRRIDSTALVDHLLDKPGISSPRTVIQIFKTWKVLIAHMLNEDVPLPANIVSRIELPDVDARITTPLTPAQVVKLAAAMHQVEPRFEVLVWLGACAGLRTGEALGLKTSRIDWSNALLEIAEQRQRGRPAKLKTKASYATLPVDGFLIERLREHTLRFNPPADRGMDASSEPLPPDRSGTSSEGLLTTNRYGRPIQRSDLNNKWHDALQLAGLPKDTRFHDLKHFYTTRLSASGQHDPKTVQALSRHADFSQTWDTYAHPPLAIEGITVTAFRSAFQSLSLTLSGILEFSGAPA
ncbi:integrase [Streptacidiphilus sp. MAP12-16]|uniref:tyrosine-type recombinase/integrase n=1 Tax=Streptacidiphilus sp. MAP12-16 TaxID=3156300 RepID=UPI0035153380